MNKNQAKKLIKELIEMAQQKAKVVSINEAGEDPQSMKTTLGAIGGKPRVAPSPQASNSVKMKSSQKIDEVVFDAQMNSKVIQLLKQYISSLGSDVRVDGTHYGQLYVSNLPADALRTIVNNFNPATLNVAYRSGPMTTYSGIKIQGNIEREGKFQQALAQHNSGRVAPNAVSAVNDPNKTKLGRPDVKPVQIDDLLGKGTPPMPQASGIDNPFSDKMHSAPQRSSPFATPVQAANKAQQHINRGMQKNQEIDDRFGPLKR